jgi:hypothetical protein
MSLGARAQVQSPCDDSLSQPSTMSAQEQANSGRLPGLDKQQDPVRTEAARKQFEQRNKDRQASLKKDTAQLLQLATELKQAVDKTNENVLSLEVIRKTQEIEKLAKSVRDKMQQRVYCDMPAGN